MSHMNETELNAWANGVMERYPNFPNLTESMDQNVPEITLDRLHVGSDEYIGLLCSECGGIVDFMWYVFE